MNVADLLLQQAQQRPDALAVRYRKQTLSYGELSQQVLNLAGALKTAGVTQGDVVALRLENPLRHLKAMLALAYCGAAVVSIPHNMTEALRAQVWQQTGVKLELTGRQNTAGAESKAWPVLQWEALRSGADPGPAANLPDAPWLYVTGSGSTGRPKIMPVTHRQQWQRSALGPQWLPYGSEDVLLSLVSMHFYAAKQRSLEALFMGAGVFLDEPGRLDIQTEVEDGLITVVYGVTIHIESLLHMLPENATTRFARLKALMVGGSTVSMRLREQVRRQLTPRLYVLYGSNETHTATVTLPRDVFSSAGSVGRPLPGFRIEIVDGHGNTLPAGQDGLIRITSPTAIHSYLADEEATQRAFADGWFYPGDIGNFTADGQLVHRGRADDMMIVSGINVYPAEIEQCLKAHQGVADVLATPLRHPLLHQLPVALVVPEPNVRLDASALTAYVQAQIGLHTLHDVIIVDHIPRNQQGKTEREKISALLKQHYERKQYLSAPSGNAGLASGTRQKQMRFEIEFVLSTTLNPANLEGWLALLEDDLPVLPKPATDCSQKEAAHYWLQQALKLARLMLQALRLPVFDAPRLIYCGPDAKTEGNWQAIFTLGSAEFVPRAVCDDLVKHSLGMAKWACTANAEKAQDRIRFFQIINRKVLRAHSKSAPKGKSTFEVLKAAYRRNIPFNRIDRDIYQLGWGIKARRIDRSTTDRDSAIGMQRTRNKRQTAHWLREAGLPSPQHQLVQTVSAAHEVAKKIGFPVVIKPDDLERGEGVTVDVTAENLEQAFALAHQCSPLKQVLVEQQVEGICHRLFVTAGRLLYAVRRLPIGVYADGQTSIAGLVAAECDKQKRLPPWKRSQIRPLDDLARKALQWQGWDPDAVPASGKFVALRRIESTVWGGVDEEVTHELHPENVRAAIAAAALLGLEVAGVDMISPDITQPWYVNNAIINEVNFAPLLGGGDISRTYLDEYLDRLLGDNGRIPVEVFVGGPAAWQAAEMRREELSKTGIAVFLTSEKKTVGADGQPYRLASSGLAPRVRALNLRREMQALVLVVQTLELLQFSTPLDRVNRVTVVDKEITGFDLSDQQATPEQVDKLLAVCRQWAGQTS